MAASIAFVGNTNNLELHGLKSDIEGQFLNDAAVTVTVKDADGNPLAGETWPQTMANIPGSQGDYVLGLTHFAGLVKGGKYTAYISADASDTANERYAYWEFPFTAQVRTK